MTYSEKLRSPEWQKRRAEILTRADWTCEKCHTRPPGQYVEVHHRYYVRGRDPWDYPDDALLALCEGCHQEAGDEIEHLAIVLCCFPLGTHEKLALALDRIIDSGADAEEVALRLKSWLACTETFDLCLKALDIVEGRE